MPAIFEFGDFGLVPRSSALGILEIKSSAYDKGVKGIKKRTEPTFAKSVTADIEDVQGREGELMAYVGSGRCFAMGVICLLQEDQRPNALLEQLRTEERVAVLFEQQGNNTVEKPEDIYRLVNFLSILRFRAAAREGRLAIDLRLVQPPVVTTTAYTAHTDDELRDWLRWAGEHGTNFVQRIAEAALLADSKSYNLLRPALIELKNEWPSVG